MSITMYRSVLFCFLYVTEAYLLDGQPLVSITRHHKGDLFTTQEEKCYKDLCVNLSSGTGGSTGGSQCECKCSQNRPVFRDDLNVCVDDIQECSLVPFASSTGIKKIPYVFLPLKGQIVYPSAEIIISDAGTPVCVVSGGQFLSKTGWLNLRNNSGMEPPFRLFRDEGRTYLQWLGEGSLRMAMEGRIILVHLMCKHASFAEEPKIFTPCIAFRVAGNPSVREVMFGTDIHLKEEFSGGLSVREYVAIGICSLLLVVVYVASIYLYLKWRRKRRKHNKKGGEDAHLTLGEEGVIKSNPLLQAGMHLGGDGHDNGGYVSDSNSCCSDIERSSDLLSLNEEGDTRQNVQTSAIIHPCDVDFGEIILNQDSNNIEKLPEENVSIVETLEAKEDNLETIKAMGSVAGRRKLYFNPSYFEPDLLKAPPPAALEFLIKIREVIAIAKHKMSAKKFSPSLLGIPEEDGSFKTDHVSLQQPDKREEKTNVSRSALADCNFHSPSSDFFCPLDAKQRIIRKWLEDVPFMAEEQTLTIPRVEENKIPCNSKLWDMNEDKLGCGTTDKVPMPPARQDRKRPSTKCKAPPLPPSDSKQNQQTKPKKANVENPASVSAPVQPPRPPPLPTFNQPDGEPQIQPKINISSIATKNLMDAVIQELTGYKKSEKVTKAEQNKEISQKNTERELKKEENQVSVIGKAKENSTDLSLKENVVCQDDHEYEVILLNTDLKTVEEEMRDLKIYNLPEIICKNERNEGYSLVSEVYVNDGYNGCSSGGSSPSSVSSVEDDKVHYDIPNEKSGRLTIHVSDSSERYIEPTAESDNFEPDTLDRKPKSQSKYFKKLKEKNEERERYSNQKFHEMECWSKSNTENNENFTDSLERPSIMLKTNGSFKRNSLEKNMDDLLRNFNWSRVENFGSLREIYEAKSKNHRRRTETTSLIDSVNSDNEKISTLSWGEERKNKLLHRGIVLHIEEESKKKQKTRNNQNRLLSKSNITDIVRKKPPKPHPHPGSRSHSPVEKSTCKSSNFTPPSPVYLHSSRSRTPPIPPPRSFASSESANSSPATAKKNMGCVTPPPLSFKNHSGSSNKNTPRTSPLPSSFSSAPPRPPKDNVGKSPPLPPRSTKPPLPPKNGKNTKQKSPSSKFAGRPLPPLPHPRPSADYPSSPSASYKDPETLSTLSDASTDSLNSSEYETFYTLPYEEDRAGGNIDESALRKHLKNFPSGSKVGTLQTQSQNQRDKIKGTNTSLPHRPEDSGYLSTDSNESALMILIPERLEFGESQNSETEESCCDGASESGAESTATDSFFYGKFDKSEKPLEGNGDTFSYTLRLSDVEVNSDTERHCVPILVRP